MSLVIKKSIRLLEIIVYCIFYFLAFLLLGEIKDSEADDLFKNSSRPYSLRSLWLELKWATRARKGEDFSNIAKLPF